MVFVTVRHRSPVGGVAVEEEIDGVYREAAKPGEVQKSGRPAPGDATWSKTIKPDPVLLFRFSALTFNPHRIHYDQPYATGTEGYPGLIVHGPLMCMLQVELARRSVPDRKMKSFALRALAPVYAGAAFSVHARQRQRWGHRHVDCRSQGRSGATGESRRSNDQARSSRGMRLHGSPIPPLAVRHGRRGRRRGDAHRVSPSPRRPA